MSSPFVKVFIGGMPRSGSTFTFNVARELLSGSGSVVQESCQVISKELLNSPAHYINKAHGLCPESLVLAKTGALKTVISHRNPIDSVASWTHTFGFSLSEAIDEQKRWFRLYLELKDIGLSVPFHLIEDQPRRVILLIAGFLEVDATDAEVSRIQSLLDKNRLRDQYAHLEKEGERIVDIGFSHYDAVTFFHRRHVNSWQSGTAGEALKPEEIAIVEQELGELSRLLEPVL